MGANGRWMIPSTTATAGTAFTRLVAPYGGQSPSVQKVDGNLLRANLPPLYTVCDNVVYTDAGTAHSLVFMRPFNWTYITTAVAANATSVILGWDPGVYSTNYKYALPGAVLKPAAVADNAIASGDYVAFQLKDGTWHVSTINGAPSGLTITLTTATPNITGGGADANTILYFFGVVGDSNPRTGTTGPSLTSGAGTSRVTLLSPGQGGFGTLNIADPFLFYSANATNAGILNASGYYSNN